MAARREIRQHVRRPLATVVFAAIAASALLAWAPAPAAAADDQPGITETADTVVRLDPNKGVLRITVTVRIANDTPDGVEQYACTKYTEGWFSVPYPAICERAVRYYTDRTSVAIDPAARNLKARQGSSPLEVAVTGTPDGPSTATVAFEPLYAAEDRTIVVTYAIRGGEPRSDHHVRTLQAFARFCVPASGGPGSTVTVRVPKAFEMTTTGAKLKASTAGGERVFSSGRIKRPEGWQACFTGTNAKAYRTERIEGPAGTTIRLRSWPEDEAWADGVRDGVATSLPVLSRLTGVAPTASGSLDILEVASGGVASGGFDEARNRITLGEDVGEPALVAHELAHAWFNLSTFSESWLAEGFAEWAGRRAAGVEPCGEPQAPAGSIDLTSWISVTASSSEEERARAVAQYHAACYLVTAVADAAGEERMTAAIGALLGRRDPYAVEGGAGEARASETAGWREVLDAVDELALGPAGAPEGLAAGLLARYGFAGEAEVLALRSEARAAYRSLSAAAPGWTVPSAIRAPLAAWQFEAALSAIDAAGGTWALTGETDALLPEVDARHGIAAEAWQAATSAKELRAAADLARRQLAGARDVTEARALLDQPLDLVQQVGRFATDVPAVDDAILAVRAADADAAAELAAEIRSSVAGLRAAGEQRIALGTVMLLVTAMLLAAFVTRRTIAERTRRAEARRLAAVVAVASAHPNRPAPPPPVDTRQPAIVDDSPTQVWTGPVVAPTPDGDPELARLVRPRLPDPPPAED